jgi:hypothetical protein
MSFSRGRTPISVDWASGGGVARATLGASSRRARAAVMAIFFLVAAAGCAADDERPVVTNDPVPILGRADFEEMLIAEVESIESRGHGTYWIKVMTKAVGLRTAWLVGLAGKVELLDQGGVIYPVSGSRDDWKDVVLKPGESVSLDFHFAGLELEPVLIRLYGFDLPLIDSEPAVVEEDMETETSAETAT